MASFIGLDLGSTAARILEAEGSARKLRITRFETLELPAPADGPAGYFIDKEVGEAIGRAFSAGKFAREPVLLSWDSALTVFRELDLPFTGAEQIKKVIKFEAEQHLLNCDIDDVVVDFYKLAETRDKSHLMVMAVRKDQLLNRFEMLSRAGIDPQVVDLDVMAAFNALSALGYADEHQVFCLVDCGRRTTNVLVVAGGRLVSARAIRTGSDSVTARLAQDLDAEPVAIADRARALLGDPDAGGQDLMVPAKRRETPETGKSPEELERGLALARAGDFYGKLGREVRRTLAMTRTAAPIETVYVTGPGSLMPGFADSVRGVFEGAVEVKNLDLLARVDHPFDAAEARAIEAELVTPLGLAFKAAGHDATGVDFRQEEAAYTRRFDQIKEPLIYFSACLLLFVMILNLLDVKSLSVREPFLIRENSSDIARIHHGALTMYKRSLGEDPPASFAAPSMASLDYMKRRMTQEIDHLKGELGRGGSLPQMQSAFAMWNDVFSAIEPKMPAIRKFVLESMRVAVRQQRKPSVTLDGFVPDQSAYEDLLAALKAIPNVVIEKGGTERLPDAVKFSGVKIEYPEQVGTR